MLNCAVVYWSRLSGGHMGHFNRSPHTDGGLSSVLHHATAWVNPDISSVGYTCSSLLPIRRHAIIRTNDDAFHRRIYASPCLILSIYTRGLFLQPPDFNISLPNIFSRTERIFCPSIFDRGSLDYTNHCLWTSALYCRAFKRHDIHYAWLDSTSPPLWWMEFKNSIETYPRAFKLEAEELRLLEKKNHDIIS